MLKVIMEDVPENQISKLLFLVPLGINSECNLQLLSRAWRKPRFFNGVLKGIDFGKIIIVLGNGSLSNSKIKCQN